MIPPTIESTLHDFDNADYCWISGKDGSTISGVGPLKVAAHFIRQLQADRDRMRALLVRARPQLLFAVPYASNIREARADKIVDLIADVDKALSGERQPKAEEGKP